MLNAKTINLEEFAEKFREEYDFLYSNNVDGVYVVGTNEAIDYFDSGMSKGEKELLERLNIEKGWLIGSDREVAAFMFAIDKFI